MKKYGYARCSTNESKQDIDRQKRELLAAGVATEDIFWEYESGRNENRKEFCRMMTIVRDGDTIVSTEISRITRSTRQLCDLIDIVRQKHMCLNIIGSVKIDCSNGAIDPMTNAFLQMAGVFAELEVNMTSARIKSGLANARAKGSRLGRPEVTAENVPSSFLRYYPKYKAKQLTVTEISRLLNVSRTTVYKYISLLEG